MKKRGGRQIPESDEEVAKSALALKPKAKPAKKTKELASVSGSDFSLNS